MERTRSIWTLAIVSVALFMVTLDNLVVTNALVSIREDFGATLEELEWTVNAYTLTFAVLLLTGAALGDRLGRRRMFAVGIGDIHGRLRRCGARAVDRGADRRARPAGPRRGDRHAADPDASSEAFSENRRGLALGIWSGVSGLGVALGPVVGGAVVEGFAWQWIFWLNVPIGIALVPTAIAMLRESHGPNRALDVPGLALASAGLLGVVLGIVRAQALGWTSTFVLTSIGVGIAFLVAFVAWELRAKAPMLPMRFFRNRAFAATNGVSLAMFFGSFGAIFLLAQFFQAAQGYSPLEAGLRTLPWTAMPIFVAPVAGLLSDRIGPRPLMAAGLALQAAGLAWLAAVTEPSVAYGALVPGFVAAGTGMALVFAPAANAVLSSVRPGRPARHRVPPTPSARSAACSAWPCSPPCSRTRAVRLTGGVRRRPRAGGVGRRGGAGRRGAARPADPGAAERGSGGGRLEHDHRNDPGAAPARRRWRSPRSSRRPRPRAARAPLPRPHGLRTRP